MSPPPKKSRKSAANAQTNNEIEPQSNPTDDAIENNRMEEELDPADQYEDEEGGFKIGDIYIPPSVKPYCSSESKGPRLIITKIMNTNFKSYADDVALGPFCHVSDKRLNFIVLKSVSFL